MGAMTKILSILAVLYVTFSVLDHQGLSKAALALTIGGIFVAAVIMTLMSEEA
jgi:hypothetical protein